VLSHDFEDRLDLLKGTLNNIGALLGDSCNFLLLLFLGLLFFLLLLLLFGLLWGIDWLVGWGLLDRLWGLLSWGRHVEDVFVGCYLEGLCVKVVIIGCSVALML